jgi:hypothetical protein
MKIVYSISVKISLLKAHLTLAFIKDMHNLGFEFRLVRYQSIRKIENFLPPIKEFVQFKADLKHAKP